MIDQTLENYKIISLLGEGGVAKVYLVEDIIDNKLYALKMLKQDYVSNQNIRKRFIDEAKKLSKLNHINVAKVYKTIDQGDIVAFSMEHIDGDSLKNQDKLDTDSIKDYMYQILEGLKEVHGRGIVHRDLTPSNVMITKNGLVKILDFGISKDLNSTVHDGTIIGTTFTMGTPRYMSPEQYTDTSTTDTTSDIYSLGVVLWEMVTNEMVYGSINTMHSLGDKILKEDLPLTKTCWDRIIQKATEKTPSERYKNCDEFISAIKEFKCGAILPWKKIIIISSAVILFTLGIFAISQMGGGDEEKEKIAKVEKGEEVVKPPVLEEPREVGPEPVIVDNPNPAGGGDNVATDSDGDGVKDKNDRCPNEKGVKSNNGCPKESEPDSDLDGVLDTNDDCPTEYGDKTNNGCPEYKLNLLPSLNKVNFNYINDNSYSFKIFRNGSETIKSSEFVKDKSGNKCYYTFSKGELKLTPESGFEGDPSETKIEVEITSKGKKEIKKKINVQIDCR